MERVDDDFDRWLLHTSSSEPGRWYRIFTVPYRSVADRVHRTACTGWLNVRSGSKTNRFLTLNRKMSLSHFFKVTTSFQTAVKLSNSAAVRTTANWQLSGQWWPRMQFSLPLPHLSFFWTAPFHFSPPHHPSLARVSPVRGGARCGTPLRRGHAAEASHDEEATRRQRLLSPHEGAWQRHPPTRKRSGCDGFHLGEGAHGDRPRRGAHGSGVPRKQPGGDGDLRSHCAGKVRRPWLPLLLLLLLFFLPVPGRGFALEISKSATWISFLLPLSSEDTTFLVHSYIHCHNKLAM
jgi:hypothetical protein